MGELVRPVTRSALTPASCRFVLRGLAELRLARRYAALAAAAPPLAAAATALLASPPHRELALLVLEDALLGFQHSPALLLQLAPALCTELDRLLAADDDAPAAALPPASLPLLAPFLHADAPAAAGAPAPPFISRLAAVLHAACWLFGAAHARRLHPLLSRLQGPAHAPPPPEALIAARLRRKAWTTLAAAPLPAAAAVAAAAAAAAGTPAAALAAAAAAAHAELAAGATLPWPEGEFEMPMGQTLRVHASEAVHGR